MLQFLPMGASVSRLTGSPAAKAMESYLAPRLSRRTATREIGRPQDLVQIFSAAVALAGAMATPTVALIVGYSTMSDMRHSAISAIALF